MDPEQQIEVKGRDLVTGIPQNIIITSEEVRKAISEQVDSIVQAVRIALEQTPPELAADIVDRGILLTGGGALSPAGSPVTMHSSTPPTESCLSRAASTASSIC